MSEQTAFLGEILRKLRGAGIEAMVVGSFGSGYWGEPRSTNDLDIVIAATLEQVEQFCRSLDDRCYVSIDAAREAFRRGSMFNIIDPTSEFKIDLIFRKTRPFDLEEFNRRRVEIVDGEPMELISPENSILSKLEGARKGGSERQLRDAQSVALCEWENLDFDYLEHWAREIGVADDLNRLLSQVRDERKEKE